MVADYFQILVLHQWSSAKSLAVVKNCNCTQEMSSLKPVSEILQHFLKKLRKQTDRKNLPNQNQTYRLVIVKEECREVGEKGGERVEKMTGIILALRLSQIFL